jgi:nucleoside-diphosphate-sugar epimerase
MATVTRRTGDSSRRLLVTGATGFIGRKLVRTALREGLEVRALVRDPTDASGLGRAELFAGDLVEPDSLEGIEAAVDAVVHCAGILGKWGMDEAVLHAVNVQGSLNLLNRFAGCAISRFIHLSAGGVTGPVREGVVDETYACRPATAYERTKLLGEQKILQVAAGLEVPAAVVRPTFTYGPGDPHKLALFRAVKRGRFAFIGNGRSVIHPVYADDLIAGIMLALDRARPGEIYIIGGHRPVTKRELVHTIADTLGVDRPGWRIPRWLARPAAVLLEGTGRALGFEPILTRSRVMMMADNFGYSIEKARQQLDYAPETDLSDGIRKTVVAYEEAGVI